MTPTEEHRAKYQALAKQKHLAITNLTLFGVRDVEHLRTLLAADEHLNNIPLRRFDNLTHTYNLYHPRDRMTLCEGCCVYKELLRQIAEAEAQP